MNNLHSFLKNILFLVFIFLFLSCSHNYTPKPLGYFRIDFPKKEYSFYESNFPYSFEFPVYANVSNYNKDSAWININYPAYNATIYITYKNINNNLSEYLKETRAFAYKHTYKADAIIEFPFVNYDNNVFGLLYDIKGDAASSINFYVTDSTTHFLRGALYFNTHTNSDSLAPVIKFIRKDINHLIETLYWK